MTVRRVIHAMVAIHIAGSDRILEVLWEKRSAEGEIAQCCNGVKLCYESIVGIECFTLNGAEADVNEIINEVSNGAVGLLDKVTNTTVTRPTTHAIITFRITTHDAIQLTGSFELLEELNHAMPEATGTVATLCNGVLLIREWDDLEARYRYAIEGDHRDITDVCEALRDGARSLLHEPELDRTTA